MSKGWKIGEVAERTGLTVRTLRHYEELGLIEPSLRTEGGHRLYDESDLLRLQQIRSLRQLGFSLEQIKSFINNPKSSALETIHMQLDKLAQEAALIRNVCTQLEGIESALRNSQKVDADDLFKLLSEMTKMESYYTPEQLEELRQRAEQMGSEKMRQAENDWAQLIADVRTEVAAGTDPKSDRGRELGMRWKALIDAFTGGNPQIEQNLNRMWTTETNVAGYNAAEMQGLSEFCRKSIE